MRLNVFPWRFAAAAGGNIGGARTGGNMKIVVLSAYQITRHMV